MSRMATLLGLIDDDDGLGYLLWGSEGSVDGVGADNCDGYLDGESFERDRYLDDEEEANAEEAA